MPLSPSPTLRRCVLVFVRAPIAGTVKTRLAARLDSEAIAALYRCFVEDTLEMLAACRTDVAVFFHPPDAEPVIRAWLSTQWAIVAQQGGSLGARMHSAFAWAFASGYDQALCIGTDIPEIHPGIVAEAFEGVRQNGCTVGPAVDGGYYMIGFAAGCLPSQVFADDIPWGTAGVIDITVGRLRAAGLQVETLPPLHDIDTPSDLKTLQSRIRSGGHTLQRTRAFMSGIHLE
ncbi:MAG: TIGR04282 family arsenosugar biosynthesis glycosyltransferase [Pseudomonadota bacterium]